MRGNDMKKLQVTLTVEEGKKIIALSLLRHRSFKKAKENGKILFKGGTTVSKITEEFLGIPLRISGRITERGTVASKRTGKEAHSIIYNQGDWSVVDNDIVDRVQEFSKDDLIICGANAIDHKGNAAIMAGSPGGGNIGKSLSSWYTEGAKIIIPTGIEKMIPGDLDNIIRKSGRTGKSVSWGMSVGLMPLKGEVFTEVEAIQQLVDVECFPIGAGGLDKAQGSITLEIEASEDKELEKIFKVLKKIKLEEQEVSGEEDSLVECEAICGNCLRHIGCGYKSGLIEE